MTTDELVAGLREYVEAKSAWMLIQNSSMASVVLGHDAEYERLIAAGDWTSRNASAIADELEVLKRKADAFDLFISCVDAVKDAEPSDVVNALLDKVKENARLRAEVERLQKELRTWKQEAKDTERAAAIQARWDARNEANNEPYGTY